MLIILRTFYFLRVGKGTTVNLHSVSQTQYDPYCTISLLLVFVHLYGKSMSSRTLLS